MKTRYVTLLLSLLFSSCFSQKDALFTELHPGVYKINNQFFYGEKVHIYLMELEDKILLFDIPDYSEELEQFIVSFKKPVSAIISHGSCGTEEGTKWQKKIGVTVYAHKADESHPWLRMKPDVFFIEMPHFAKNILVIHTPGHSAGSICVLEKNSKSLFTGDTFQGNDQGNIVDFTKENQAAYENLEDRINSCKKLLAYDFENVYPFHYNIISKEGKEALANFLIDK